MQGDHRDVITGAGMEESPEYVAWLRHREPAYWNWLPGSGTNDPERKQSRQVLMSRYGAGGATVTWVFWCGCSGSWRVQGIGKGDLGQIHALVLIHLGPV